MQTAQTSNQAWGIILLATKLEEEEGSNDALKDIYSVLPSECLLAMSTAKWLFLTTVSNKQPYTEWNVRKKI